MQSEKRDPLLIEALIPIVFLIGALSLNVLIFGDDGLSGSSQIILLLSAAVAGLIALRLGYNWDDQLSGIINSIIAALPSILILLLIGSLAGTWMISGVVPAMIYYGLDILNPSIFLFAAVIISAIVSVATGSSWSTIATIGVALLGIGLALGIPKGLIAGAIISGAYFGDKMSPLSDTTNLAAAMGGTNLFTHIKYMAYTTIPSITITLIIFLIIGFFRDSSVQITEDAIIKEAIEKSFHISAWLFLVPVIVIALIIKRVPAVPALLLGTLLGAAFALFFQSELLDEQAEKSYAMYRLAESKLLNNQDVVSATPEMVTETIPAVIKEHRFRAYFAVIMQSMYGSIIIESNEASIQDLLATGGMSGMLKTIWLILCAMIFGGIMESSGMLKKITRAIIARVKSVGSLVSSTVGTCIFFNLTASDQYLSIVVPGRMYASTYEKRGLKPEVLSRSLEDSGTVTSVLIPWNTCGATQATILGVSTIAYLPFCFFNIISPFMSILYAIFKIKIRRIDS